MREFFVLFVHLLVKIAQLMKPGGARAIVAENLLLKQQLLSHTFVERLIGTVRREFLDHILFWNATDLQRKLDSFQDYYNHQRVHASCDGRPPGETAKHDAALDRFGWQRYCHGLYELPIAV